MSVMAAQYTAPPLVSPPPFQQYGGGVQYNPNHRSSTTSPSSSASPPSPRTTYMPPHLVKHSQIRQPKTPLYIPAVLRPTEKRMADGRPGLVGGPESAVTSTESLASPKGFSATTISRVTTEDWNDDALGKVTGPPTRDHWKPDPSSPKCSSSACATQFSLLQRRHHCRRCGNIFCQGHSAAAVPLDQHARFHPEGTVQRACDKCAADYGAWLRMRSSRSNSSSAGSSIADSAAAILEGGGDAAAAAVHQQGGVGLPVRPQQQQASRGALKGALSGSVPRDWSWSTF